jgi:hypothetical protein
VTAVIALFLITLWVIEAPARLVEYDLSTFTERRAVAVPARAAERPELLAINAKGQVLFQSDDAVWVWDGSAGHEFPRSPAADTLRQWFLSSSGDVLYAFESQMVIERDPNGVEREVRVTTRLLRTDLSGNVAHAVLALADLPRCSCETGACLETCPA